MRLASVALVCWAGVPWVHAQLLTQESRGLVTPLFTNHACPAPGVTADVDGNGTPDLAFTDAGRLSLMLDPDTNLAGAAAWLRTDSTLPYGVTGSPAFANLDGDALPDLVVADGLAFTHRVVGTVNAGGFSPGAVSVITGGSGVLGSPFVGDVDGDGLDDVVAAHTSTGSVSYRFTVCRNAWPNWVVASWGGPAGPVAGLADFDGDGHLDVAHFETSAQLLWLYFAIGGGVPPISTRFVGTFYGASNFITADVDLDGRADLLFATGAGIFILFGHPTLGLEIPVVYLPLQFSPGIPIAVADLDQDGIQDIVVRQLWCTAGIACNSANYDQTALSVFRGRGARQFQSQAFLGITPPANVLSVSVMDIDADGDPDLFGLPTTNGGCTVFRNESRFGHGCAGSSGVPILSGGSATLGNAAFALSVSGAAPNAPVTFALSRSRSSAVGCGVAISVAPGDLLLPDGSVGSTMTDAAGASVLALPIPSYPYLAGLVLHGQAAIVDPSGGLVVAPGVAVALTPPRTFVLIP